MQTFKGVESYLHRAAKGVVLEWLRAKSEAADFWFKMPPVQCRPNRGAPYFGIYSEWPIAKDGVMGIEHVWDETEEWAGKEPPTPEELIAQGLRPFAVVDIAVLHKGRLGCAVEIVHRHPVPEWKRRFLQEHDVPLVEVCAKGVLHQVRCPDRLPIYSGRRAA